MSDTAVGKNGIGPPQLAPARIFRPGDAGFPAGAGESESKFRNCEHPGCGIRYLPGVPGLRYCLNHNTPSAAAERDAGMVRGQVEKKPVASKKHCVTCSKEFQATGNAQKRCPACKAKAKPPTKPKPEKPSAVAAAIGNLRAKATVPVQPTSKGSGSDLALYQALSERRAQMLADIAQMLDDIGAIDRVLAIV